MPDDRLPSLIRELFLIRGGASESPVAACADAPVWRQTCVRISRDHSLRTVCLKDVRDRRRSELASPIDTPYHNFWRVKHLFMGRRRPVGRKRRRRWSSAVDGRAARLTRINVRLPLADAFPWSYMYTDV
ncbi:hypothetical protein EVAR_19045_1 [Eumeta japonica]|uniref:Uncharacterized protein n=1 Tax=Eumeta variegata TaxID=151549 RepID=A0A4C1V9R1_EUMVA|nr:hypothetical protein EVAR_19045_1 [Eumeta japonica]